MAARGLRNNNPLNIRKGCNWKGERPFQTDDEFEEFQTLTMGARAALKLMRNHITGFGGRRPQFNTLRKLITVWAPPTENATDKYVQFVSLHTGLLPSQRLNPDSMSQMCKLARAMAKVECGEWIDIEVFKSAFLLL